jgi:cell division protein FtsQ
MKTSSNPDIRKHKGSVLLSALLLAVLITTFLAANGWKRDLHISTVRIEGNTLLTDAEILALAAIPANENLFDIDLYAVRQRLQRNHFVKNADVSRHLPNGITITIIERVPVAALVVNHLLYVDENGYVLPALRPEQAFDLPVLTGNLPLADCLPGRQLSGGPVKEALSILIMAKRGANELEQLISEIHIEPDSSLVIFTTESGIPV